MAVNDKLSPYAELIDLIENLPILVRETRRRRGLSMRAAADLTGLSFTTFARFEDGRPAHSLAVIALLRFVGDLDAAIATHCAPVSLPRGVPGTRGPVSRDPGGAQKRSEPEETDHA
jgi:transcriptional regulator with XRE-family HTH domain